MRKLVPHLFVLTVLVLAGMTGLQGSLRDMIMDLRFRVVTRAASGTIAMIEIDAPSIDASGVWPWPRRLHAELLEKLDKIGVSDIAFDVDFSSASDREADERFANALKQSSSSVILASFRQRGRQGSGQKQFYINRPLPIFAQSAWAGLVNVVADQDGLSRHYSFGDMIEGEFVPSMGALLAGTETAVPGEFRIDFGIRTERVPRVSFIDVLKETPEAMDLIRGRKVIVSGTALELGDRLNVPNGQILPGSLLQILAAESLLQDRAISVTTMWTSMALAALLALIMLLIRNRLSLLHRAIFLAGSALACEVSAFVIQSFFPIAFDTSLLHLTVFAHVIAAALNEIQVRGLLRSIAEHRFRKVAMSLADGFVCIDQHGRITFANTAVETIFGYTTTEIHGRPWQELLTEIDRGQALQRMRAITPRQKIEIDTLGSSIEMTGLRRDGVSFDLECSLSAWHDLSGISYGAVLRDITERKAYEKRLFYIATHDILTGLSNRTQLVSILARLAKESEEQTQEIALILLAFPRLQDLGEIYGLNFSDEVLCEVARTLVRSVTSTATVARVGDHEFAVMIETGIDQAMTCANTLYAGFQQEAIQVGDRKLRFAPSIGVNVAQRKDLAIEEFMGNAHLAFSQSTLVTGHQPAIFAPHMRQSIEVNHRLEAELRIAIAESQFELFYQPQVDLISGSLVGAEALIRWRHPQKGYVPPGIFMPFVNNSVMSEQVSAWVMRNAMEQAAAWEKAGQGVRVGINLSPSQFNGNLAHDVISLLAETGLDPHLLELEITEDIMLVNVEAARHMLTQIRAHGVKIALDDFGTGYGNLSYLKTYPVDTMKVDQTFVRSMMQDGNDTEIVAATVLLGRALGLCVIAEGIEDEQTATRLREIGCAEGQGYLYGKPMPAEEFERKFLRPASKVERRA